MSLCCTPLVIAGLRRHHVLDLPSDRSSHAVPTPRGGGMAVAVAAVLAVFLYFAIAAVRHPYLGLEVCLTAVCFGLLGFADDLRAIGWRARLALQGGLALVALAWILHGMTGPDGWIALFALGSFVWVVGFVNTFNFMDGINGIATVQAVIAGLSCFAIAQDLGRPAIATVGLILVGAALGFAPFNFPRARVFLGDTGSYFIGAWLAVMLVMELRSSFPPEAALAPLSLFLADTTWTLVCRVHRHEAWSQPHRCHTYQRLVALGWSHARTTSLVGAVIVASSALGAVSLTSSITARAAADALLAVLLVSYLSLPTLLARHPAPRDAQPKPVRLSVKP